MNNKITLDAHLSKKEISSRDDLIAQLSVAAELEQGLCIQYLFTAASLKDAIDEGGLTLEELNYVRKWKANIYLIAAQEMLHLSQVANIVSALGFGVNLNRPNFPQSPSYYPTDLPWGLWPFSPETIILYALYERPAEGGQISPDWLLKESAMNLLLQEDLKSKDPFVFLPKHLKRPESTRFETIGELYAAISKGIAEYHGKLIIGSPEAQVKGVDVDLPQLMQIFSRQDAQDAIQLIVLQGEGCPIDRQDSHFGLFKQIYQEYIYLKQKRKAFIPVRDVQSNPLSRLHVDNTFPGWRLIDDQYTAAINDLNSNIYRLMLMMIYRLFTSPELTIQQRQILVQTFLRIMTTIIKPLGELLTQLPMGDDGSAGVAKRAKFAGPSFEMDSVLSYIPYPQTSWCYMKEELNRLYECASTLAKVYPSIKIVSSVANNIKRLSEQFVF